MNFWYEIMFMQKGFKNDYCELRNFLIFKIIDQNINNTSRFLKVNQTTAQKNVKKLTLTVTNQTKLLQRPNIFKSFKSIFVGHP